MGLHYKLNMIIDKFPKLCKTDIASVRPEDEKLSDHPVFPLAKEMQELFLDHVARRKDLTLQLGMAVRVLNEFADASELGGRVAMIRGDADDVLIPEIHLNTTSGEASVDDYDEDEKYGPPGEIDEDEEEDEDDDTDLLSYRSQLLGKSVVRNVQGQFYGFFYNTRHAILTDSELDGKYDDNEDDPLSTGELVMRLVSGQGESSAAQILSFYTGVVGKVKIEFADDMAKEDLERVNETIDQFKDDIELMSMIERLRDALKSEKLKAHNGFKSLDKITSALLNSSQLTDQHVLSSAILDLITHSLQLDKADFAFASQIFMQGDSADSEMVNLIDLKSADDTPIPLCEPRVVCVSALIKSGDKSYKKRKSIYITCETDEETVGYIPLASISGFEA